MLSYPVLFSDTNEPLACPEVLTDPLVLAVYSRLHDIGTRLPLQSNGTAVILPNPLRDKRERRMSYEDLVAERDIAHREA